MSRGRSSAQRQGALLPLLIVLGIVAGVIGVASFSSRPNALHSTTVATSTASASSATRSSEPQLALLTDQGVSVVSLGAAARSFSTDEFAKRFAEPFRPLITADVANGETAPFRLDTTTGTSALISPDRRYAAQMTTPTDDHASVVAMTLTGEPTQRLVLRSGNRPIRDGEILTWEDSKHVLIGGTIDGARVVFRVSVDGAVSTLATLPASAIWIDGEGSAVWYATAEAGEGLESEPRPPSSLHLVTSKGDVELMKDDHRIVLSVVASTDAAYAVRWSDGTTTVRRRDSDVATEIGKRQALLFLRDGRLVVRDGFALSISDREYASFTALMDLPAGRVHIAELPIRLDELQPNP